MAQNNIVYGAGFGNQDEKSNSYFGTFKDDVGGLENNRREELMVDSNNYVTRDQLDDLEEKLDLKIKVAIQPIEGKIDNLPTQFKNMLLEERQYQEDKRKETQRYILGTIGIGLISIIVSVVLHFI